MFWFVNDQAFLALPHFRHLSMTLNLVLDFLVFRVPDFRKQSLFEQCGEIERFQIFWEAACAAKILWWPSCFFPLYSHERFKTHHFFFLFKKPYLLENTQRCPFSRPNRIFQKTAITCNRTRKIVLAQSKTHAQLADSVNGWHFVFGRSSCCRQAEKNLHVFWTFGVVYFLDDRSSAFFSWWCSRVIETILSIISATASAWRKWCTEWSICAAFRTKSAVSTWESWSRHVYVMISTTRAIITRAWPHLWPVQVWSNVVSLYWKQVPNKRENGVSYTV